MHTASGVVTELPTVDPSEALTDAYRRHSGEVFAFARRLLSDTALAEEVTQEVFLRLWCDPGAVDHVRGTLRSYLMAHCHGRSLDVLRSVGSRRDRELRHHRRAVDAGPDVEKDVLDLVFAEELEEALAGLPDEQRTVIVLAYFGGSTYKEVAELLGQPEGTVKSRVRRGLHQLRADLEKSGWAERRSA